MRTIIEATGSGWICQTPETDWLPVQTGNEMFVPPKTLVSVAHEGGVDFQIRASGLGTNVAFLPSFEPKDIKIGDDVEIVRAPQTVTYKLNGPKSAIRIQRQIGEGITELIIGNTKE